MREETKTAKESWEEAITYNGSGHYIHTIKPSEYEYGQTEDAGSAADQLNEKITTNINKGKTTYIEHFDFRADKHIVTRVIKHKMFTVEGKEDCKYLLISVKQQEEERTEEVEKTLIIVDEAAPKGGNVIKANTYKELEKEWKKLRKEISKNICESLYSTNIIYTCTDWNVFGSDSKHMTEYRTMILTEVDGIADLIRNEIHAGKKKRKANKKKARTGKKRQRTSKATPPKKQAAAQSAAQQHALHKRAQQQALRMRALQAREAELEEQKQAAEAEAAKAQNIRENHVDTLTSIMKQNLFMMPIKTRRQKEGSKQHLKINNVEALYLLLAAIDKQTPKEKNTYVELFKWLKELKSRDLATYIKTRTKIISTFESMLSNGKTDVERFLKSEAEATEPTSNFKKYKAARILLAALSVASIKERVHSKLKEINDIQEAINNPHIAAEILNTVLREKAESGEIIQEISNEISLLQAITRDEFDSLVDSNGIIKGKFTESEKDKISSSGMPLLHRSRRSITTFSANFMSLKDCETRINKAMEGLHPNFGFTLPDKRNGTENSANEFMRVTNSATSSSGNLRAIKQEYIKKVETVLDGYINDNPLLENKDELKKTAKQAADKAFTEYLQINSEWQAKIKSHAERLTSAKETNIKDLLLKLTGEYRQLLSQHEQRSETKATVGESLESPTSIASTAGSLFPQPVGPKKAAEGKDVEMRSAVRISL